MTPSQQRAAARRFAAHWAGKGDEKGQSQTFWNTLLRDVFGVERFEDIIHYEDRVLLDHTAFMDARIPSTRVLIEQKSVGKDLRAPIRQSDGTMLTPFEQAKRYVTGLPVSQHPRWIVTCNFAEFLVYDMEQPQGEPQEIALSQLETDYHRLAFLVDEHKLRVQREMQVSMQAGDLVGQLYDALLAQYLSPDSPATLHSLNVLCVRLVFCLYAEDAGVFGQRDMFHNYLAAYRPEQMRGALIRLFATLDTPTDKRDPYLDADLQAFPYVNGGLFAARDVEVPQFTPAIATLLLDKASLGFDWSDISPTIFGAVFESTLNPDTRRKGGMHYTSIENIHRVIDPLFFSALEDELAAVLKTPVERTRQQRLTAFHKRLATLHFLDPACGSGNFLTETYLSLRRMENRVIQAEHGGQTFLGTQMTPILVSIAQFHGIEINDFAVTVATTALWIAEAQTMQETEQIVGHDLPFLPLKSYATIAEGNALRMQWEDVVPPAQLSYIMGNPPFVGFTYMSAEQKADMALHFGKVKNLDFVSAWYKKASDYIKGTRIECAFVSTNSITQGETVARLWPFLDIKINFAYQTFRWDSEADIKAHVHCVIIGFADFDRPQKKLFNGSVCKEVTNINAYLCDAPNILVESRSRPLCKVPNMVYGNKPADGGNLIVEADEYDDFVKREPKAVKFIRPLLGAAEFINNKKRYCLWLVDASPSEIRSMPLVKARVEACRQMRLSSVAAAIQKFADCPTRFAQVTQPDTSVDGDSYIIVPCHSSERREYVPMDYMPPETIATNAVLIIPSATLYHFGVLTSSVHMAWMRAVCGRLKSDYRYSKDIVYNNFPWAEPDDGQRAAIAQTAQAILDARKEWPDASLADLYDPTAMPPALRKAHRDNDRAVARAYGIATLLGDEPAIVARLMTRYEELTARGR